VLVMSFSLQVVKNIVLAGVNVVLQDSSLVTVEDLGSAFCVSADDVGQPVRSPWMYVCLYG
jgi:hypothetical protein